ncbi:MAG: acyl-CoA dehydratase activase [Oscillospiraceae bacterium]|nr:acyl-CoA dehydratase activase [Oscillospiraceae bacterium]
MQKSARLGLDIGSVSTKAVVTDEDGAILASSYLWTQGGPVPAVKEALRELREKLPRDVKIVCVGVTGSARRLIGAMLEADAVKNEITAHAAGTLSRYPDTRTILEIGGQDSKIILLDEGIVTDYAMNSLCAAGTGAFLSAQAKRLGMEIEELGAAALRSRRPSKIAARCSVFAESDMIHKAQTGHSREDLVAGLCRAVVLSFLNNVGKGKRIRGPVVFQGGVSKNIGVLSAFRAELAQEIHVDVNSHLMGAVGASILADSGKRRRAEFDFSVADIPFSTQAKECAGCANSCEVVSIHKDGELLDRFGARCGGA